MLSNYVPFSTPSAREKGLISEMILLVSECKGKLCTHQALLLSSEQQDCVHVIVRLSDVMIILLHMY